MVDQISVLDCAHVCNFSAGLHEYEVYEYGGGGGWRGRRVVAWGRRGGWRGRRGRVVS